MCKTISISDFIERIHGSEKNHKCETCGKCFFDEWRLRYHEKIHTEERPFKCQTCKICFKTKSALKYHEGRHTGKLNYYCTICKKGFRSKSHFKILHKGKEETYVQENAITTIEILENDTKKLHENTSEA